MTAQELRAERDALLARIAPLEADLRRLNAAIRQAEAAESPEVEDNSPQAPAAPAAPEEGEAEVAAEPTFVSNAPEMPSALAAEKTEAQGHRLPQPHVTPVVPVNPQV